MDVIKNIKPWTWALGILIVLDAIVTTLIGSEANPLILWVMNKFNLTLDQAMFFKVLISIPPLTILNQTDFSRLTFFLYIVIYFILVGCQI